MIVSFHPCFSGDIDISCAGRPLHRDDIAAIQKASAVILPQACRKDLFLAADRYCPAVFPDLSTCFDYPGKIGQIRLFRKTGTPHPPTEIFNNLAAFRKAENSARFFSFDHFPRVIKFDWSDEGRGVFLACGPRDMSAIVEKIARAEETGQTGFLVQEYIETRGHVLRVCVINTEIIAYWRVQTNKKSFRVSLADGAVIDRQTYPRLQEKGVAAVKRLCDRTGINLAGFDVIFDKLKETAAPLILEINYYFGRRGLGGSEEFYNLLTREIQKWLKNQKATA